jgi:hypothetical protein
MASRKDLPMFSRIRDRIAKLEEQILPKPRVFVFFRAGEPGIPAYAEQLAAFKAEKGVGQHDIVAEVSFTFDA